MTETELVPAYSVPAAAAVNVSRPNNEGSRLTAAAVPTIIAFGLALLLLSLSERGYLPWGRPHLPNIPGVTLITGRHWYPSDYEHNFMAFCQAAGSDRGIGVRSMSTPCKCSLYKMEERYSYDEARAFELAILAGGTMPSELSRIISDCAK